MPSGVIPEHCPTHRPSTRTFHHLPYHHVDVLWDGNRPNRYFGSGGYSFS
jgi:hypothetical protein